MLFICECLNGSKALITSIYWWENLSQCFYFGCFSNFSQYVMWRSSYFLLQQLPTKLNKKYRWTEMNLLTKHVKFKSELYCCKTQTEIVDNMIKWTYLYLYGRKKKKDAFSWIKLRLAEVCAPASLLTCESPLTIHVS